MREFPLPKKWNAEKARANRESKCVGPFLTYLWFPSCFSRKNVNSLLIKDNERARREEKKKKKRDQRIKSSTAAEKTFRGGSAGEPDSKNRGRGNHLGGGGSQKEGEIRVRERGGTSIGPRRCYITADRISQR